MAAEPIKKPLSRHGKLSGWPRPQSAIAKTIGLTPIRMAILIVMALGGIFGGYYLGKEVAPAPKKSEAPKKASSTQRPPDALNGVYEESLPRDIIIESGGVLKRIALPEPEAEIDLGNGSHTQEALSSKKIDAPDTPESITEPAEKPQQTADPEDAIKDVATPSETPSDSTDDKISKPVETARLTNPWQIPAMPKNIAELQKSQGDQLPAWQRYALPVPQSGKPRIVIVIDDLGLDKRRARRTVALPGPLTLSYMAYAEDLPKQAEKARKSGHEIMLHVPMEPSSSSINPGPNVLLSGMPKDELQKNIDWNLDQMSGYVGINNHMGSRFTADTESMRVVIATLKARGYLFLDSVTSGRSVAHDEARDGGIPFAVRNVFLDHEDDLDAIRQQLRHTEQIARKTGLAIAIGHPRDNTIAALKEWLPSLNDRGFQLVPVSAVVRIASK